MVDRDTDPDPLFGGSRLFGLLPRGYSSLLAVDPKLSFEGCFFHRLAASFFGMSFPTLLVLVLLVLATSMTMVAGDDDDDDDDDYSNNSYG